MKKGMKKLVLAMFVMVATLVFAPKVDAKAYGITQTNPAKNSITVTWTAKDDATAYYVYVGEDYSTSTLVATLPANATSYTINGLPAGCERYVGVKYKNVRGYEGSVGSEYDCRTIPDAMTKVYQERWYYFLKSFNVEWEPLEAADTYEYILYNAKGKKLASTTTYSTSMSYSKKVSNNMIYNIKVRAVSEICGQKYYSAWSNTCYCFTQPRVKSVKASNGKLQIKWQKITGATGYDIYVSTKPTTGYKKVKSVGKSKSSVTIKKFKGKKIKSSKKYYVYVASKKKVGKTTSTSGRLYYWNSKNKKSDYF